MPKSWCFEFMVNRIGAFYRYHVSPPLPPRCTHGVMVHCAVLWHATCIHCVHGKWPECFCFVGPRCLFEFDHLFMFSHRNHACYKKDIPPPSPLHHNEQLGVHPYVLASCSISRGRNAFVLWFLWENKRSLSSQGALREFVEGELEKVLHWMGGWGWWGGEGWGWGWVDVRIPHLDFEVCV